MGPNVFIVKLFRNPEHAYKVTVDVINKGDVALPYPDGHHSTLGEVGNGSLVAWPKAFVTFTDET